jgi:hypothetical protein
VRTEYNAISAAGMQKNQKRKTNTESAYTSRRVAFFAQDNKQRFCLPLPQMENFRKAGIGSVGHASMSGNCGVGLPARSVGVRADVFFANAVWNGDQRSPLRARTPAPREKPA